MAGNINNSTLKNRRRTAIVSEINVTPLVDVMLVLLIIFMITSPMLVTGVSVDLPETNSQEVSANKEPLTVTIDKNGKVYIMESLIDHRNLTIKLKSITKQKMDSRIFVRGDKTVPYGKIMKIVGQISEAGFSKVALITDIKYNDKK